MKLNPFSAALAAAAPPPKNPIADIYDACGVVVETMNSFAVFPDVVLDRELHSAFHAWLKTAKLSEHCPQCGDSQRWVLPDGTRPCHCEGLPPSVEIRLRTVALVQKEGHDIIAA
jgi:hypothetical protein